MAAVKQIDVGKANLLCQVFLPDCFFVQADWNGSIDSQFLSVMCLSFTSTLLCTILNSKNVQGVIPNHAKG